MLLLGTFDSDGNATINIRVDGNSGFKNYTAIIDTGFSGFVALPILDMVDLGLKAEGAANVTLGDGSTTVSHLSSGIVTLGSQAEIGTILLDENSTDVLVGMALLREFKLALILTNSTVVLYDEHEAIDAIAGFMGAAPQGQPNTAPTVAE
jgi:predicted aspartyl protease